jgi:hypothetical protein
VPVLAALWSLTDENSAAWSAAIAGFRVDSMSDNLTAVDLDRQFSAYMAAAAGTSEQHAVRELPKCVKVAQYVHTCDVHGWKLRTNDQSAHANRRVGIALCGL